MKIPSGEGVGMVNSPLVTQVNSNPITRGFATRGELKLPFVTHGEFIIPTPPSEGIAAFMIHGLWFREIKMVKIDTLCNPVHLHVIQFNCNKCHSLNTIT